MYIDPFCLWYAPALVSSRVVVILHALRRLLSAGVGVTLEGGEENRIAGRAAIYLFMWFRQYISIYRCLVLYVWTARRRVALSGDEIIELHACMLLGLNSICWKEGGGCRCSTSVTGKETCPGSETWVYPTRTFDAWYV